MKTVASICAGVALVTGIVSVSLWRELRTERQANRELRTQLIDARAVRPAPAMPVPVIASTVPATATTVADPPVCKPDTPPPKPVQPANANIGEILNRQNDLLKDPEYRKLWLAQARLSIERNNSGLAEELGLSEKEADKLFNLLAENQVAMSTKLQLLTANGNQNQAAMEERARRQQAIRTEQDETVRAMLGGKYPQYQQYQQALPARSQVMSIGMQLAQAGLPLTDAQTRSLTKAMAAEQQRQTQEDQMMPRPTQINPTNPDARLKMMEESLKRTEDNNRRMIEAFAPYMSAKQLATLREQMEQQTAMNRISLKGMQIEQQRLQPQAPPRQ